MFIKREKGLASLIIFLTIFGIAMGFLEAAVVVYLRELYYPEGFTFPLKPMALEKLSIEYMREISTLVMLFSIGVIAGRNSVERFSFFLYSFGVWDIFYYAGLKVLLNWPSSLLTWDILFLIPVVWVSPILAPVICSVTMIGIAGCILYFQQKGYPVKINSRERVLFLVGALIIFSTFVWNYSRIIIQGGFITRFLTLGVNSDFQNIISHYTPTSYNWYLFTLGEVILLFSLASFYKRIRAY